MRKIVYEIIFILLLAACRDSQTAIPVATLTKTPMVMDELTVTPTQIPTSIYTPIPQLPPRPVSYSPDQFPQGYNPLTGQPMIDK